MSFRLGAVALLLLGVSCQLNDGVLNRAAGDYFPLRAGSEWRYAQGTTTSLVRVRGDSVAYNYPCMVVERDFEEQYWIKRAGELRKFVSYVINIGGTDYALEQRYRTYYKLPFLLGNTWSEDFTDTVEVLGSPVVFEHRIQGHVAGVEEVQVTAGAFAECYRIELNERIAQDSVVTDIPTQEWYAPDVGLVKRVQGTEEETLVEYDLP